MWTGRVLGGVWVDPVGYLLYGCTGCGVGGGGGVQEEGTPYRRLPTFVKGL